MSDELVDSGKPCPHGCGNMIHKIGYSADMMDIIDTYLECPKCLYFEDEVIDEGEPF